MRKLDKSALFTAIGVLLFLSISVAITVVAPYYIDPSWTTPSSSYQQQVYEKSDPNLYISTSATGSKDITYVYHMQQRKTLSAFVETENVRIVAPPELRKYVTHYGDKELKLTTRVLLLSDPSEEAEPSFSARAEAKALQNKLKKEWESSHPNWQKEGLTRPAYKIYALYSHPKEEAFARIDADQVFDNWVEDHYILVDSDSSLSPSRQGGFVYIKNPEEYRIRPFRFGRLEGWEYDPFGSPINSLQELRESKMRFLSRQELIRMGEETYAQEGCWYCHTDQSRTLVQDSVLNGSDSYPSPPSSANEYIYNTITMTGTRRIGPDLSRVGIKRPSRDWHKAHFWSPKTKSAGSIMPPFQHFFDDDPRGTPGSPYGVPNWRFEAIFQYLMTKGTRITPPQQGWWTGKDPVQVLNILERQPVSHQ